MIDLHCHILPGIDDGPADTAAALDLGRAAVDAGSRAVVATPHVSWTWPGNDAVVIAEALRTFRLEISAAGLGLELHGGAEVALTRAVELSDVELEALCLAGGPWLLLEPPITQAAAGVEAAILALADRGHQLILAHPERIPGFQREPGIVARLVERGMLCQLTASSLVGRFGRDAQRFAERLLHDGLIHAVASDAHSARQRPPEVRSVLRSAGLPPAWIQWLCEEVPASVVAGGLVTSPPGVPAVHPIRRRLLRSR